MMKETNLAIVFGPVFAYPPSSLNVSKQQFLAQHLPALSSVCELMISHFIEIFHNERVLDCLVFCQNNWTKFKQLVKESTGVPFLAEGSQPKKTGGSSSTEIDSTVLETKSISIEIQD